jgi:hypothetical protein
MTWVQPLKPVSMEEGFICLRAPTPELLELTTRFREEIIRAVCESGLQVGGLQLSSGP